LSKNKYTLNVSAGGEPTLTRRALIKLIHAMPGLYADEPGSMQSPRVILWDLDPWGLDLGALQKDFLVIPLIIVANSISPLQARAWIQEGIMGCLEKTRAPTDLSQAIRQVSSGETYLSPGFNHPDPENIEGGCSQSKEGGGCFR
jgi:hypothetical protein